jgi:hypothetical protein
MVDSPVSEGHACRLMGLGVIDIDRGKRSGGHAADTPACAARSKTERSQQDYLPPWQE